ncbi:MAG: hypothetical protein AcusKO_45330 [Acuticoccus sp.]
MSTSRFGALDAANGQPPPWQSLLCSPRRRRRNEPTSDAQIAPGYDETSTELDEPANATADGDPDHQIDAPRIEHLDPLGSNSLASEVGETEPTGASSEEAISLETARNLLISLRERISDAHPDIPQHANILRKSMMAQLLRQRPVDQNEFLRKIPQSLRTDTLPPQLSLYGKEIFEILERVQT